MKNIGGDDSTILTHLSKLFRVRVAQPCFQKVLILRKKSEEKGVSEGGRKVGLPKLH